MNIRKAITTIILAFVLLMFILSITPAISSQIKLAVEGNPLATPAVTPSITNDFVVATLGVVDWLIPVGAILALVLGVLKLVSSKKGRGQE